MTTRAINPAAIAPAWSALQRALPIRIGAIHNEAEYDGVVSFMNSLLDVVGDNEDHELADLLDLVAQLVEDYEGTRHTLPDASPHQVLRLLMDQHSLKQTDLGGRNRWPVGCERHLERQARDQRTPGQGPCGAIRRVGRCFSLNGCCRARPSARSCPSRRMPVRPLETDSGPSPSMG